MSEKEEAATLASDYLDNLIRTADKYEIEREKIRKNLCNGLSNDSRYN